MQVGHMLKSETVICTNLLVYFLTICTNQCNFILQVELEPLFYNTQIVFVSNLSNLFLRITIFRI